MMWYDDGKKTATDKIAEAIEAYIRHFKTPPTVVLVSDTHTDATAPDGVTLETRTTIGRFEFWVGMVGA